MCQKVALQVSTLKYSNWEAYNLRKHHSLIMRIVYEYAPVYIIQQNSKTANHSQLDLLDSLSSLKTIKLKSI